MKKSLKSKKNIIFQIIDWGWIDLENDDDMSLKYTIRLYGKTIDNKNIYVRVDNFTPHFYILIPERWRQVHVKIFIDELMKRVNRNNRESLLKYDIVKRHKFYYFTNETLYR